MLNAQQSASSSCVIPSCSRRCFNSSGVSRHFVSGSIESSLISLCLNIVSSMTSISEPNSGKSAYLFRHALNSPNACCSSSAFSDSVMISSPPIVIALLIFPTLLCFFSSWFSTPFLSEANSLYGPPSPHYLCPARRPRIRRFHMHRGLASLPDFHAWNGSNPPCPRYETIAQPAHNS